jgi:hypothetical protein
MLLRLDIPHPRPAPPWPHLCVCSAVRSSAPSALSRLISRKVVMRWRGVRDRSRLGHTASQYLKLGGVGG